MFDFPTVGNSTLKSPCFKPFFIPLEKRTLSFYLYCYLAKVSWLIFSEKFSKTPNRDLRFLLYVFFNFICLNLILFENVGWKFELRYVYCILPMFPNFLLHNSRTNSKLLLVTISRYFDHSFKNWLFPTRCFSLEIMWLCEKCMRLIRWIMTDSCYARVYSHFITKEHSVCVPAQVLLV